MTRCALRREPRGIRIYLNCGDHAHIGDAISARLKQLGLDWDEVTTDEQTVALCKKEPKLGVALVIRLVGNCPPFRPWGGGFKGEPTHKSKGFEPKWPSPPLP